MLKNKNYLVVLFAFLMACFANDLFAQESIKKSTGSSGLSEGTGLKSLSSGSLGIGGGLRSLKAPVSFSAKYEAEQSGERGRLVVTATIEKNHYVFSTTQPKGGPMATVFEIESKGISLAGPFVPDRAPEITLDMQGFEGIRVEKFYESISWTAPINFEQKVQDDSLKIDVTVDGQVCRTGACIPVVGMKTSAEFAGFYAASLAATQPFRDPIGHVEWTAGLSEQVVAPGGKIQLFVTAKPERGYHVFPLASGEEETSQKTLITITQAGTLDAGLPSTDSPVKTESLAGGAVSVTYHEGNVTWAIPIKVPEDKVEGVYPISGVVGYQACNEDSCDQPLAFQFSGEVNIGAAAQAAGKPVLLAINKTEFSVASKAYLDNRGRWSEPVMASQPQVALAAMELFRYFAMAMLGGLILNFMPCVLPVIGLKVMSFIDESNGSSRRIAALNLWYTAGILVVFMGFALGTVIFKLVMNQTIGWGQQFQSFGLQLTIIILLTAMALSFLGVWEIPIPGFANHGKAVELSTRQGAIGAFTKGLIATFIAIPCSGPMLGPVFALTLTQPAWVILLMFLGMGLGMASPYLVFAAYPQAMKLLPKPGNWMITFKQLLAFPLLLAVVWFISTVEPDYRIAALTIAVMTGMACWVLGKVPAYAEASEKVRAWGFALALIAISGWGSVRFLGPRDIIDWLPYNEAQLQEYVAAGQPVFIDFTASWCSTCQVNSLVAIETRAVADALSKHKMVPMLADLSKPNAAISRKIQELNSNSIPLLAIYPAGPSAEPVVLRDLVTKGMVLDAIDQAVAQTTTSSQTSSTVPQEKPAEVSTVTKAVKKNITDKSSVISKPILQ